MLGGLKYIGKVEEVRRTHIEQTPYHCLVVSCWRFEISLMISGQNDKIVICVSHKQDSASKVAAVPQSLSCM